MMSKRTMVLGLVAVVAMAAFSGCSSTSSPTSPGVETNRVSGTVRSETGEPLADIPVWLGAKLGGGEVEVTFQDVTDQDGYYELEEIEMATEQSSETTYTCYVNRTPARTNAVDADYDTWTCQVSVPATGTIAADYELDYLGGSNPDSYIDD